MAGETSTDHQVNLYHTHTHTHKTFTLHLHFPPFCHLTDSVWISCPFYLRCW